MKNSYSKKNILECGIDEAGRGCLAGPVTAAAVILPNNFRNHEINDSKKLTADKRNTLRKVIEKEALAFSVAHIDVSKIDEINILNATILGMHTCIDQLTIKPEFIVVDGNRFKPYKSIPHKCIIKGDQNFLNIAAASILAKSYRDELMLKLHSAHPSYGWSNNKGYPTKKHRELIKKFGTSAHHRKSFKLL